VRLSRYPGDTRVCFFTSTAALQAERTHAVAEVARVAIPAILVSS
jgi:hypothetical protein